MGKNSNIPKINISQKPTYVQCATDIDFHKLFQVIEESSQCCFLLESLGENGHTSRYSVIGFDPVHKIYARGLLLFFDGTPYETENPYFALQEITPQTAIARRYSGGLVGYLGYECINYFEPTLQVKPNPLFNQFSFGVFTDGLVLDKATQEVFYFYYDTNRMDQVETFLSQKATLRRVSIKLIGDELSEKEHAENVLYVKREIRRGNVFQCEVGFKTNYRISGDARRIYARLREVNPSPYMYYLKFGEKKIIGASPELLFRLSQGEMETFPLAGTIRRGETQFEDNQLARELLSDPKEVAEHLMLVDLQRNDLGRVARFGAVKVRDLMDIKKFSHVQHISSEIAGILGYGRDMFSSLAACFPAGTLTGAPKIEAMKIIDRIENSGRGPYGGAVGHFGFSGDCTFVIPIRTLFISGDEAYTQTCGGIVHDSDPVREYEEIMRKSQAMKEAMGV